MLGSTNERGPSGEEEPPDRDVEREKPMRAERQKQETVDFGTQMKRP